MRGSVPGADPEAMPIRRLPLVRVMAGIKFIN
jgi:hypothetical protein